MDDRFVNEYVGQFPAPDPEYKRALRAWLEYEVSCETYDRSVCTGGFFPDGGARPGDEREMSLIQWHSKEMMKVLRRELAGVSPEAIKQAEREAGRYSYEQQIESLKRLTEG